MLPQVGRAFLGRMRFFLRPLFKGRNLLMTNTLSVGGIMALGDFLQQSRELHQGKSLVRDWRRTGCMFAVGCSMGPALHYWYTWLDRVYVGTALKTVGKKVLVDQAVASPVFGVWFFVGMSVTEGHTLLAGLQEFKDKFWEFFKADCCVWPPAQLINFYFVSPKFRVVYISVVTLGWDTYLSYIKHRSDSPPAEQGSDSSALDVQQEALQKPKPQVDKA
ncbi:mpv17-like protein 2 [Genypterus blacodes]|uniref:mpv17-like protein 2 n=1 Tax=Genypterus blacodes TaxID=154954 RepID=UPI003F75B26B